MAAELAVPVARFEEVYWKDRILFDRAGITPEAYWSDVAKALALRLSNAGRERLIELDNLSWAQQDPVMVSWATALRGAGVRTAVLSNMPITLRSGLARFCPWLPEFDHSCYSCDVGQAKPGPEIYLRCLEGLGDAPETTLFLDDREENIEAARKVGIHAIHFSSPGQAQCEIDQHYDLPVPILFNTGGQTQ